MLAGITSELMQPHGLGCLGGLAEPIYGFLTKSSGTSNSMALVVC